MNDCCTSAESICPCGGFTHPSVIFNPPGLDSLSYRVGDYTAFRHALLQSLPGETELSSTQGSVTTPVWRPSGHGDLALQMMEWWAYIADILTFYNQRIANQAYLGTADLPESVNRLVRLLGYRPRPGIGAFGTLAALANTPLPFTLPQGFAIQSKPGPGQPPQIFELIADTTVGVTPTGPVSPAQMLGAATTQPIPASPPSPVAGASAGSSSTITVAGTSSAVKKGNQVLVLPKGWPSTLPNSSGYGLAIVTGVTPANDPIIGKITNIAVQWQAVSNLSGAGWQLYKGGQSTQVWQYPCTDGKVVRKSTASTSTTIIDLESIVRGIQSNDPVLIQYSSPSTSIAFEFCTVLATSETVWYANPSGYTAPPPAGAGIDPSVAPTVDASKDPIIAIPIPHTSVTLTADLSSTVTETQANRPNLYLWHSWAEVADLIAPTPSPQTVGGSDTTAAGGGAVSLQVPDDITVLPPPSPQDGKIHVLVVDSVGAGATGIATAPPSATVVLDTPTPLLIPPLQTYFNLLAVNRGKTVPNETLGTGNAVVAGQDFTLKNSPVTYLSDPASGSGSGYSSTIKVYVNGLQWTEVPSFFGQTPDAQVFVTSEDVTGATHVSFGDGVSGSRLPTGANVTATYRYGSGATAPAAGSLTVVLKPQPGLRSIVNPIAVGGGSDPDPSAKIQQFAPQSVLTFGRAVSADDFRVIAAQASGVTRAAAAFAFDPIEQRPRVTVWVGDDQPAVVSATNAIAAAADPNRLPSVILATQIQIKLSLTVVVGLRYQSAMVVPAVYSALLDPDTGLFGVNNVAIGQAFFDSQIYEVCLAVPGVSAVRQLEFTIVPPPGKGKSGELPPVGCGVSRHDPGAGNYYFLADDGSKLTINGEGP